MQRFLHVRGCPLGLINVSEGGGVRITILEWPSCFRRSVGPFADGYPHLARLVTRIALTIRFTTFRIVSASVPAAGGVALGNNKDQDGAGALCGIYAARHNVALGCSDQRNVGLGLPVLRRRRLGRTLPPGDERFPALGRNPSVQSRAPTGVEHQPCTRCSQQSLRTSAANLR
jgi:hypothetical protein